MGMKRAEPIPGFYVLERSWRLYKKINLNELILEILIT